jgi:hypothetical protein
MKRSWRDKDRRCERCKADYHPQRQSQSYCSRVCRRAAAYGRERFVAGTKGRRRRRLEASDKWLVEASETLPGRVVAGSFRKRTFSSIKPVACKRGNTPVLVQDWQWPHLYRIHWPDGVVSMPANLTRCRDAIRNA